MHKEYTEQIEGLYSRHCADIENEPPEPPQSGSCLLLIKERGAYFREDTVSVKLHSWKYWWELNLVVGSKSTLQIKVLADLNMAVWYGIAICIHVRKNLADFNLVIVKANCQVFQLYGISVNMYMYTPHAFIGRKVGNT